VEFEMVFFQETTQQLAGKVLLPGVKENDTVKLVMNSMRCDAGFALYLRNQLTSVTAFAVVHALKHLCECSFDRFVVCRQYIFVTPFTISPLALRLAQGVAKKSCRMHSKYGQIMIANEESRGVIALHSQFVKLKTLDLLCAGDELPLDDVLVMQDGRRLANRVTMQLNLHVEYFGKMIEVSRALCCSTICISFYSAHKRTPLSFQFFRHRLQDPSKLITREIVTFGDTYNRTFHIASPSTLYLRTLEECGVCVLKSATKYLYEIVNEPSGMKFTVSVHLQPERMEDSTSVYYQAVISYSEYK
jgi:hypothetical protein